MYKPIVVLDCGSQYTHLICAVLQEMGYAAEVFQTGVPTQDLQYAAGVILSGGPQSVYEPGSPQPDPHIVHLGIPVLGLCYGLHWMAQTLGGEVKRGEKGQYGKATINLAENPSFLLQDCGEQCTVWMSHGDECIRLPADFRLIAASDECVHAAFADEARKLFALQFHPEVTHTDHGRDILRRFAELCAPSAWSREGYVTDLMEKVHVEAGDRSVFMLVSGGVDSTVAFALISRALGSHRVYGLLIDTGLMRKNEISLIREALVCLGITNLHVEDASAEFFRQLVGVVDPEKKRTAIGREFVSVYHRVSAALGLDLKAGWMLGQGTIYPDTIETGGTARAAVIKTHHNRVPEIQALVEAGLVIEPLKHLYKDGVRRLGEELGLPHEVVWRHPFPGPALAVRILCANAGRLTFSNEIRGIASPHIVLPVRSVGVQGDQRTYAEAVSLFTRDPCIVEEIHWQLAVSIPNMTRRFNRVLACTSHPYLQKLVTTPAAVTRKRASLLCEADAIVDEEVRAAGLYDQIWQFPVVLLPCGLHHRGQSIVLRPVESVNAMTANAVHLPSDVLRRMTERLLGLPGIEVVFLDLTSKPPGTIEWE